MGMLLSNCTLFYGPWLFLKPYFSLCLGIQEAQDRSECPAFSKQVGPDSLPFCIFCNKVGQTHIPCREGGTRSPPTSLTCLSPLLALLMGGFSRELAEHSASLGVDSTMPGLSSYSSSLRELGSQSSVPHASVCRQLPRDRWHPRDSPLSISAPRGRLMSHPSVLF